MILLYTISNISSIVWSLPPFRQYKGKFFNYFLILAISDPLGVFLIKLGYRNNYSVYAVAAAATLLSVMALNKNISRMPAMYFILFTMAAGVFMPLVEVKLLIAAILIVLIYYFIRYMIIFVGKHGRVNFFHVLFLVYNVSLTFKLINIALELQKGQLYFYFTTGFEIILGILFCIFREGEKQFAFKLSKNLSYDS